MQVPALDRGRRKAAVTPAVSRATECRSGWPTVCSLPLPHPLLAAPLTPPQATATTPSTLLPPPLTAHSDADGHKKQRTSVDGGQQGEHPAAQGSNTHQQQAQQQQQAQAQQQQPSVPAVQVPT